jgi:hypothetical protein
MKLGDGTNDAGELFDPSTETAIGQILVRHFKGSNTHLGTSVHIRTILNQRPNDLT